MVNLGTSLPVNSETIDPEILPLVIGLNKIKGCRTYSSCQGHTNQFNDYLGTMDLPYAYIAIEFTDPVSLRLFAISANKAIRQFQDKHHTSSSDIMLELDGSKNQY